MRRAVRGGGLSTWMSVGQSVGLAVVLSVGLLAGCGGDPVEDYCAAVEEHQAELSEVVASGGPDALLRALDVFRDLESRAPGDIRDEWQQVVGRLEALDGALRDADVDPASYDRADPPAGLTAEQRTRIEAAGRELVAPATAEAFEGVQQQARDVCQTPLTL